MVVIQLAKCASLAVYLQLAIEGNLYPVVSGRLAQTFSLKVEGVVGGAIDHQTVIMVEISSIKHHEEEDQPIRGGTYHFMYH